MVGGLVPKTFHVLVVVPFALPTMAVGAETLINTFTIENRTA